MTSVTPPSGLAQGSADELNAKGMECNRRGDTRGALALFLEAHTLRPSDARFVLSCADTSAPVPPYCTCRLRLLASGALYVSGAQGSLRVPASGVPCVLVPCAAQVLSAGNMRLKLGEPTEASALYAKLDALSMTPRQQEMAHTKRRMSADLEAAQ